MKKLILILIILCVPLSALALDPMKDKDLDQVTARFGTSAANGAQQLAAPAGIASGISQDLGPLVPPAAQAVVEIQQAGYNNDRSDDIGKMTTYSVNMNNVRLAVGLGFF